MSMIGVRTVVRGGVAGVILLHSLRIVMKVSCPLTLIIPIAPPCAVAMAHIVCDMYYVALVEMNCNSEAVDGFSQCCHIYVRCRPAGDEAIESGVIS